jgi:hypothetical protein
VHILGALGVNSTGNQVIVRYDCYNAFGCEESSKIIVDKHQRRVTAGTTCKAAPIEEDENRRPRRQRRRVINIKLAMEVDI